MGYIMEKLWERLVGLLKDRVMENCFNGLGSVERMSLLNCVPSVPTCQRALRAFCAYVPTCSRAITTNYKNKF